MKTENKPDRYHAMSVPHETRETADAAFDAFCKDVEAAREKHRIMDVHVVFEVAILLDGKEGVLQGSYHLGAVANAEGMLAFAFGRERRRREDLIARLTAGKSDD